MPSIGIGLSSNVRRTDERSATRRHPIRSCHECIAGCAQKEYGLFVPGVILLVAWGVAIAFSGYDPLINALGLLVCLAAIRPIRTCNVPARNMSRVSVSLIAFSLGIKQGRSLAKLLQQRVDGRLSSLQLRRVNIGHRVGGS